MVWDTNRELVAVKPRLSNLSSKRAMNSVGWNCFKRIMTYLAGMLSQLTGKWDYAVDSSTHFVSTISRERVQNNKNMVSSDVESLFTNVSIEGDKQAALRNLGNDPGLANRTTLTLTPTADLLNFVSQSTTWWIRSKRFLRSSASCFLALLHSIVCLFGVFSKLVPNSLVCLWSH